MPRPGPMRRPDISPPPRWLATIKTADGVFVADLDRRIVAWSAAAERIFGRSAEEVIGHPCNEVLGADDPQSGCGPGCRPVLEARRGRMIAHPDIAGRHADGRAVDLQVSLVMADDGECPPVLLHLVRPRSGPGRRAYPAMVVEATSESVHDEVPPLVNPLSPRELEVLRLLSTGQTTRQIADFLTISRFTVRNHLLAIERKLGAHSHVEAVYLATRHGLL